MDVADLEENLFVPGDAKLHGGMCQTLSAIIYRVLEVFPFIEASRPRSKSGIQTLCSLHVAVERAKNILRHCSDCSKLYLAITGESVLMKFEKARCTLRDCLRHVQDIVPESIGVQVMAIVHELEGTVFELDRSDKDVGEDVISLFRKEDKMFISRNDTDELGIFHQAALKLRITSSRAALTERRALKKLIERARAEEDRRKESIVSYLLDVMRRYSKHFRSETADDTDSQGSTPSSPAVLGPFRDSHAFTRHFSRFSFHQNGLESGSMPIPPEEFRCPISLQLMYDPVIVSSGQTYERICIEKWFNDGHMTCPKTQQQLAHICVIPNYCVKGLIASWCEQNGVPILHGPPGSLDTKNYCKFFFSECEFRDSRSMGNSYTPKGVKVGVKVSPLDESCTLDDIKGNGMEALENGSCHDYEIDEFERCENLLAVLNESQSIEKQCTAVEQLRFLLKNDGDARSYVGANGVELLVQFLRSVTDMKDEKAQGAGAMALSNLVVNNDRNKGMLLSAEVLPLLEKMISSSITCESAAALYLNLSCLDDAKPAIGETPAIHVLVKLLQTDTIVSRSCKHDALYTLYNLSTYRNNVPLLVSAGIVDALHSLLADPPPQDGFSWVDKTLAVFVNLTNNAEGKKTISSNPGVISCLATLLDTAEPAEQEQIVSCLLNLCIDDGRCSRLVLQEGVVPALVALSANGTPRGMEKAQNLLLLFREQRQREPSPVQMPTQEHKPVLAAAAAAAAGGGVGGSSVVTGATKRLCRSKSKKFIRTLSSAWKKNFTVHQCYRA